MTHQEQHERDLVERIALVFESAGLAPIACRILGRLLLCEPAEQSSTELADWLGASKGSVSTQTQVLVRGGFIRRLRRPGSRAIWYALEPNVWSDVMAMEVLRTQQLMMLGQEGQSLKRDMGIESDQRLEAFLSFCAFFLERLPSLIEEWKAAMPVVNSRFARKEK
jgi:hypothetical protein